MNAKCVITADVVGSRQADDFIEQRDHALKAVRQGRYGLRLSESTADFQMAVTAWDEFQLLLGDPACMPQLYWRLIAAFAPLKLRIGIGFGPVFSTVSDESPINEVGHGPAFEAARAALSGLNDNAKESSESLVKTQAIGVHGVYSDQSSEGLVSICNATLAPVSVLANEITTSQWEVFRAWDAVGSQTEAARELGVSVSTVSRGLSRSRVWLISESLSDLHRALVFYFALPDTTR